MSDQKSTPLYDALIENNRNHPFSFHVPGHKYGQVFAEKGKVTFESVLSIDATEITGLDDLHAPEAAIEKAQKLAGDYFQSDHSFFLVNGSTVGNLAMIMTVCGPGDEVIVQRNCHKSVLNGLELAGAKPVFISPVFEEATKRYSKVTKASIQNAIQQYPNVKAVCLTYPDYFGRTYPLRAIANVVHEKNIPLLIDEAHGVHFQLGDPFPAPALREGADIVVQSAHKMAPAMTMSSFLHVQSDYINVTKLKHYLQMLQSSSPSYPLMASLDLARFFLSEWNDYDRNTLKAYIAEVRDAFAGYKENWRLLPLGANDDPLKMTLEVENQTGFEAASLFEESDIYPELATSDQLLFILGLKPSLEMDRLKKGLSDVDWRLKNCSKRATIKVESQKFPPIQKLEYNYAEMSKLSTMWLDWSYAAGYVAAEAIIPYPPGVALIMKGERITRQQIDQVHGLLQQGARFQNRAIDKGIRVFKGE